MTPEEALGHLNAVALIYKGSREEHGVLQNSVITLDKFIKDEKDRVGSQKFAPKKKVKDNDA